MNLRYAMSVVAVVGGCAGHDYALEHYGSTQPQVVTTRYDRFGIRDNPQAGRLFVMVQRGPSAGLVFNPYLAEYPKPHFQDAAEIFLAQSGRRCEIYDASMILEQRWEFRYRCETRA